jgi:hypothetical protein
VLAIVGSRSDSSSEPQAAYRFRYAGSSPFEIVCMATTYRDAAPTFDAGTENIRTVLGCWVQRSAAQGGPVSIPDVTHAGGMLRASEALDHFRELGELDLEINHGIEHRNSASR